MKTLWIFEFWEYYVFHPQLANGIPEKFISLVKVIVVIVIKTLYIKFYSENQGENVRNFDKMSHIMVIWM